MNKEFKKSMKEIESFDDLNSIRSKLEDDYEKELPDYIETLLLEKEGNIKSTEFFKKKYRDRGKLYDETTPETRKKFSIEKNEKFWKEEKFELVKKKRKTSNPVFEESSRNLEKVEQERNLTQEEINILIKVCENDIYLFAIRYFSHYLKKPSSSLHKYLYGYLNRNLNKKNRKKGFKHAIAAPRKNAKSTIISAILPLWCIAYNKKHFIIICSDTAGQAEDFLSDITRELLFNELLKRDFPHLSKKGPIWRNDTIITNNDIKVMALGTGSKIRGRRFGAQRPDLVIGDDLESSDMVRSPSTRDFVRYEWFNKDLLYVGGEEGSPCDILVVGTILGKDSLLSALLDPGEYPDWTSRRFKAVLKFSYSELWKEWGNLSKDRFNPDRIEDAKKFFISHIIEMLEGTDVLWPEGESYYELMIYRLSDLSGFLCFKQGTPILTENNEVPIEEIKVGDTIVSGTGKYEKVEYVSERKSNSKIVSLKIAGIPDTIEATEEHPFLIWPKIKYQNRSLSHQYLNRDSSISKTEYRKNSINNRIENNKLVWKLAKDLKIGDSVVQPLPENIIECKNCNKNWWWLVGYYLAEGHVNYTNNTINFAAHITERDFLERTINICKTLGFGKTYTIRNSQSSDKCIYLTVCSKSLCDILKKFGRYGHGKFLNDEVYSLCFDCFNSLWDGYYSGDGYIIERGASKYEAANSASKKMLIGFKNNWLRFGVVSYLYKSRKPGIGEIRGRKFNARQLWSLQLIGKDRSDNQRVLQSWIHDKYLYSRVQRVDIEDTGINTVYGLSVSGNKTYCIPGAVVHNSEKQNDPVDASKILVSREQLHFKNFNTNPEIIKILANQSNPRFGFIDPSLGRHANKGDYSCITTIVRDKSSGYLLVTSFDIKRRKVDKQIDDIIKNHDKNNYKLFGVETNAFQLVVADNLRKKSRKVGAYVPVEEVVQSKDKKMRVEGIVPLILDGTIIFDSHADSHSQNYNLAIEQIVTFTGENDKHDDAPDCLSSCVTMAKKKRFRLITKQTR